MNTLQNRPSEVGGVAGAIALLVAHFAGLTDPNVIVWLAVVIGFTPAAITWLVTLLRGHSGGSGGS